MHHAFDEVADSCQDVTPDVPHIDALSAMCVLQPREPDVIVASDLFGDSLSDLIAAVAGSIGIAASADLDPEGEHPSMFDPFPGSVPPSQARASGSRRGQIWSAVLADSGVRRPDPGGSASTSEVAAAVTERLGRIRTSPLLRGVLASRASQAPERKSHHARAVRRTTS